MEYITYFIDFFLHLDKHLDILIREYGVWTYTILFLIIFCETGLVITPILPGDSLLFAAGALAGRGGLNVHLLASLLFIAAVIGDTVNYHIGHYIGPKVLSKEDSRIFRKEWLDRTQRFYEKYGGKTIIFARFVPIVRTFAPFLAGVGKMNYFYFLSYNVIGGFIWIFVFIYGGYMFGGLPFVKKNFTIVIIAIIILSIMPGVIEYIRARREKQQANAA